jgi:hypothetical protein
MTRLRFRQNAPVAACKLHYAWQRQRNAAGARVKWMFTTDKARGPLRRLWNAASCTLQIHIYLPPSRPNSVLKIGSHPSPLCRSLGFANVQDDVAPLFCLVGLGPAIAIKVAAPPASLVVEPAQDQSKIEPAFAPNELAKADRLELPDNPVKTEIVMPATKTMPAESPSTSPEAIKSTGPETIRLRAGIGKTPTPGSVRSRRLVGILRAKKRRKAQANPPERKS